MPIDLILSSGLPALLLSLVAAGSRLPRASDRGGDPVASPPPWR